LLFRAAMRRKLDTAFVLQMRMAGFVVAVDEISL